MSEIWKLYKKPTEREGEVLDLKGRGVVRYYTGQETYNLEKTNSPMFYGKLGFFYSLAMWSYWYCTKNGMIAQRCLSSAAMLGVPAIILLSRKGEDTFVGSKRKPTLEERLQFYPITRRALERAIADIEESK